MLNEEPKQKSVIKTIKIKDLKPYGKNPKIHSQSDIEKLAKSIELCGLGKPPVVNKDLIICCGHRTVKAAEFLGWKEIEVKILDLNKRQFELLNANDNIVTDNSLYDYEKLDLIISELILDFPDIDLSDVGIDNDWASDIDIGMPELNLEEDNRMSKEDKNGHWQDMPEFVQEKKDKHHRIIVYFNSNNDIEEFAKTINQNVTLKTKYINFPKLNVNANKGTHYGD